MNPFLLKPLLRAVRGRSLTFAVVFATAVLGASITGFVRQTLSGVGLWLPLAWLVPILLVGFLAKKEDRIPLSVERKRLICLALVIGSVVFALGIWRYEVYLREKYPDVYQKNEDDSPRRTGPRGK
jgi:hypothetical protein